MRDDKWKTILIKYGIGYGEHDTDAYVPPDASEEEIEEIVHDTIQERLWWSWERDPEGEE